MKDRLPLFTADSRIETELLFKLPCEALTNYYFHYLLQAAEQINYFDGN